MSLHFSVLLDQRPYEWWDTVISKSLASHTWKPCILSRGTSGKKAGCNYSEGLQKFVIGAQGNLEKALIKPE